MNEIKQLLDSGADANTMDKNNFTLLMSFVKSGNESVVRLLLDYGAKTNVKDLYNMTALDYAIKEKHNHVAKLLVENGAKVTSDNYMYAVQNNNKELVKFFDSLDPDKQIFFKSRLK
jgi:ankyrin repeat protein